jgi:hypothetical protein
MHRLKISSIRLVTAFIVDISASPVPIDGNVAKAVADEPVLEVFVGH